MFLRREKRQIHHQVREFVWPGIGWRRASRYMGHRIMRLSGTPYGIAAGFACGAAVSFTPFIGMHFILAALIAWLIRGHIIASALGTAVGNPWSFPFIWLWTYKLGQWSLGADAEPALPDDVSMHFIFDHPMEVLLPMFVGSLPTAAVVWIVCYWPLRGLVAEYQHLRRRRLAPRRGRRNGRRNERKAGKISR